MSLARCWYVIPDIAEGGTSDAGGLDATNPDGAPQIDGSLPPTGFLVCGIAGGLCPVDGGTNDADEMLENLCCADTPDAASTCGPITGACMNGSSSSILVQCEGADECGVTACCFSAAPVLRTFCQTCQGIRPFQLCRSSSECPVGTCDEWTCGDGTLIATCGGAGRDAGLIRCR
jgi:hypothetical protein